MVIIKEKPIKHNLKQLNFEIGFLNDRIYINHIIKSV